MTRWNAELRASALLAVGLSLVCLAVIALGSFKIAAESAAQVQSQRVVDRESAIAKELKLFARASRSAGHDREMRPELEKRMARFSKTAERARLEAELPYVWLGSVLSAEYRVYGEAQQDKLTPVAALAVKLEGFAEHQKALLEVFEDKVLYTRLTDVETAMRSAESWLEASRNLQRSRPGVPALTEANERLAVKARAIAGCIYRIAQAYEDNNKSMVAKRGAELSRRLEALRTEADRLSALRQAMETELQTEVRKFL